MNNIYFIVAQSGSGKTSICNLLKEKYNITFDNYDISITAEQIENNDLYIIDPKGIDFFMESYKGSKTPKVIFISSDMTTRYERMKSRAEENDCEFMDAVKSSLERITNDVVEFYDYIHNNAHVDFKVINNGDCNINSVVDKIYEYIRSCEGGGA